MAIFLYPESDIKAEVDFKFYKGLYLVLLFILYMQMSYIRL